MKLDDHGQPPPSFNFRRNMQKAMDALYGLCAGIVADSQINDKEIIFLDTWLRENSEYCRVFPASVIASRVSAILADGIITEEERSDLMETIMQMLGGTLEESGSADGLATRLPIDNVDHVNFLERGFCFTGKFVYGPRTKCQREVVDRGGYVSNDVTLDLDYLVIGTLASRDWVHKSHGRKIEKALKYKEKKNELFIISEEIWLTCLNYSNSGGS